ncbi:hypothetical protein ACWKWJ_11550 [Sphingopyxis terrae subsp. ummariensis]
MIASGDARDGLLTLRQDALIAIARLNDGEILCGGGALRIQCSSGIVPTLSFEAGENVGSGAGTIALPRRTPPYRR